MVLQIEVHVTRSSTSIKAAETSSEPEQEGEGTTEEMDDSSGTPST